MLGPQFLVSLDLDLGHDLEAGLKPQRLALMNMQIGDPRLRNGDHAKLLGFLAEVFRYERLNHIALQVFLKSLPDDRSGYMPGTEPKQPRHLLIFCDKSFDFTGEFIGWDFHRNLTFHPGVLSVDRFCRT